MYEFVSYRENQLLLLLALRNIQHPLSMTLPNIVVAEIYARMPVILRKKDEGA